MSFPSCLQLKQVNLKLRLDTLATINHLWYSPCERCWVGESHTPARQNSAWREFFFSPPQFVFSCLQFQQLFSGVFDAIFRYVSKHVDSLPNPLFETCFATFPKLNENIPPCVPTYFHSCVKIKFLCLPISAGPLKMQGLTCDKIDAYK